MNSPTDPLWLKISEYSIDDPGAFVPFSVKLAKEQNWSLPFTQLAIDEYKKFIYLCCISPTGASPSPVIDEVWHLHLTYTVDYWQRFCKEILGKDIQHHPSGGGDNEYAKHKKWYEDTLKLYTDTFQQEPPGDIWYNAEQKSEDQITIPRGLFSDPGNKAKYLLVAAPFLLIIGLFHQPFPFNLSGIHFLMFYLVLLIIATLIIVITLNGRKVLLQEWLFKLRKGYMPEEINCLLADDGVWFRAVRNLLVRENIIKIKVDKSGNSLPDTEYIINKENACCSRLSVALPLGNFNGETIAAGELKELTESSLRERRLKFRELQQAYERNLSLYLLPFIAYLIGICRCVQGITNNKPVTYLVVLMALFTIILVTLIKANNFRDSTRIIFLTNSSDRNDTNKLSELLYMGTAGIAIFAVTGGLRKVIGDGGYGESNRRGSGFYGSSFGSSCGGGGSCGGGCGGCSGT